VTTVKACVRGTSFTAPAALAPRERLVRLSARVLGDRAARVTGPGRSVRVKLAHRLHGRLRAIFTEVIRVGRRRESFKFTRVYHGC
jgi:hypothetical protein